MKLGTSMYTVWKSVFKSGDSGRLECDRCFLENWISQLPARGMKAFEFSWDPADTMEALFDKKWRAFLERCQSDWDLSFSIHLPQLGLDVAAFQEEIADASINEMIKVIQCTDGLNIAGYVLHVGITCARVSPSLTVESPTLLEDLWRRTAASARRTLPRFLEHVDARKILIENLPYASLDPLLPVITEFDLGMCLDVGHADRTGEDPAKFFVRHKDRIREIHFHDVKEVGSPGVIGSTTDHQALGTGHIGYRALLETFVREEFQGDLVIEVPNPEDERISVEAVRGYLDSLAA